MVGKGVLYECLDDSSIESVTVINRSSLNMDHPKLTEVILKDFMKLDEIRDQLSAYDACFHCMGVSALGLSEEDYSKITFGMTKVLADIMYELNPQMVFNYVSGSGTDSSEKGRIMWARVKGKTENYLLNKGFRKAIMFRPGGILPEKGTKSKTGWYNAIYVIMRPFFPLFKKSKNITTTTKIGRAMINSINQNVDSDHLENPQINILGEN